MVSASAVVLVAPTTENVKFWLAGPPTPLLAVKVSAYVPPVPDAGVPASVPVPLPLSVNVTLLGSATPPRVIVGYGKPVVVTPNVPAEPIAKLVAFALVIDGASLIVSVKFCVGDEPLLLFAVNVIA